MKLGTFALLLLVLSVPSSWQHQSVQADGVPAKTWPSVPRHMLDATVQVSIDKGHGSGVCVGDGTLFLTACHVVTDDDGKIVNNIYVELETAKHKGRIQIEAKVVAYDLARDVAVIKTPIAHKHVAKIGSDDIELGAALFAVGAPGDGHKNTATLGYLAAKSSNMWATEDPLLWQSSNAVWFGNSGGPIYDANSGLVVGICVQITGKQGLGFAPNCCFFVSLDIIKALLKEAVH